MNARADWRATLATLTPRFAERAAALDAADEFVAENYAEIKASGLLAAGVPQDLGGQGLELAELCEMLRTLARACPSTALAFSMHTHQVVINTWRLRHQKAPVAPLLEKVARERIVIVATGGGDWLDSSGDAVPAKDGFRVTVRKAFASGAPAGSVVSTSAVVRDGRSSAEVIHFLIPMSTPGVSIAPTWRTLGMRSTASHDLVLEDVFVPDERMIGPEGNGWNQVSAELAYERSGPERWLSSFRLIAELIAVLGTDARESSLEALGGLIAQLLSLRQLSLSVAGMIEAGVSPNVEAAIVKDLGTKFEQESVRVVRDIVAAEKLLDEGKAPKLRALLAHAEQWAPAFTIRGGTNEILRGVIARGIGLR